MFLSFAFSALFLLLTQPNAAGIPGSYWAQGEEQTCQVLMMPSATIPPAAQLVQDRQSGLAAVQAECGLDIADAGLWELAESETGLVLSLIGQDGRRLWIGRPEDNRSWQGETETGVALSLTRDRR